MRTVLRGALVTLRPSTVGDIPALAAIRTTPEVYTRWRGGDDLTAAVTEDLEDPGARTFAVEHGGRVVGAIQWGAED